MLGFETVSRFGGLSYLGGARLLAGTITQGSFEEGFVFLPKYLIAVDGVGGFAIVAFAIVGVLAVARKVVPATPAMIRVVLIFTALYLVYGFQSAVLERMVFTGRYSRVYIPALVWLAGLGLASLRPRFQGVGSGAWLACSLAGFVTFALGYRELAYPTDVLYRLGIGYEDLTPESIRVEFEPLTNYNLPVKAVTAGANYVTVPNDTRFIIVNFALPAALKPNPEVFTPPPGYSALFQGRHFVSSPTFAWEGAPSSMRERLFRPGFLLSVFLNEAGPSPTPLPR